MSRLEDLIKELCPNGVEVKTLGELGTFYGGLAGKSKSDFSEGNAKFVTYMNVYSNPATDLEIDSLVKISEKEKQNAIRFGDVLFTGSSETPEECGMSSVVTEKCDEKIYLNSFCFGFRLNDLDSFCPDFLKHVFRSGTLRKQIFLTASGVTRFNVSKQRFASVQIPVPPLDVQREIARILDKFATLEAELEAELEARRKQYIFYRERLFEFNENVEFKSLAEICTALPKGTLKTAQLTESGYPVVNSGRDFYGYYPHFNNEGNAFTFASRGENAGFVAYLKEKFWAGGLCYPYRSKNEDVYLTKFIYYYLKSKEADNITRLVERGSIPALNKADVNDIPIPVPPLAEQKRIVEILDKFSTLIDDISSGLPAEIKMRHQQYEYYRDKLLTFTQAA